MAQSFNAETPILSYGPRGHTDSGPRNERGWLLWPAWAYRVVVPKFERRRINPLQQAILGILRASKLTAMELGERLGVHPELAAFVVTELQSQSRVDESWRVTTRGVEALDEQRDASARLIPGWVFQDPYTQTLWPFVAASLEYARTQPSRGDYPLLDLGTTGKPWLQRTWMQFPRDVEQAEPPGPLDIIRAAANDARLTRQAQRINFSEEDNTLERGLAAVELERVSRIEPEPQPVFLSTYLYVPRDDDNEYDWHACDFFGRGSNPPLRRLIDKLARNDHRLTRVLDDLLNRTLGHSFDEQRRNADARSHRALHLVERALTVDISSHGVAEPLTEVVEGWLEIREVDGGGGLRRRRGVLAGCRLTLERLFRELGEAWPLAGVAERLTRGDKEANAAQVRGAAADLLLSAVPDALCNVPQAQVRSVADYNDGGRLRALIVATMLRARGEPHHPLRTAAASAPDLLERIELVAQQAGAAVHDGGEATLERADIDHVVQVCVDIVGHICKLPARRLEDLLENG